MLVIGLMLGILANDAGALSESLRHPKIFFAKNFDTNRAEQIHAVLRSEQFNYIDGMTSYWEPKWSTTLVYAGNAEALNVFIVALNELPGMAVHLTFSPDLSKETGSVLRAGSWWLKYSHTTPNTLTVRINLGAEALAPGKLELTLPQRKP